MIEGAARQPFLTFMHDSVFVPLGMTDTLADQNEDIIKNRSRWYNLTLVQIRFSRAANLDSILPDQRAWVP